MTVVSGAKVAMIPSGANAPRWARANIASRCAAADSQPRADTHGGDSLACRRPSTAATVNMMVGGAEARNVNDSPRWPTAMTAGDASPAAA